MTRQHKTHFYSSEGMRRLQAQIDELWEAVEHLINHPPMPIGPENLRMLQEVIVESATDHETSVAYTHGPFPIGDDAVRGEGAAELRPEPFKVVHVNRGWYQVVDGEGKPIHEGKLRKESAEAVWQTAIDGLLGEQASRG